MKFIFKWITSDNSKIFKPCCYVIDSLDERQRKEFNALSCLLTDDGGRGYLSLMSWPDEGLKRIKAIKMNETDVANWSSDSWGATLTNDGVKVYSLYDEDYFDTLSLDALEKVLLAWKDFIHSPPELVKTSEVEI